MQFRDYTVKSDKKGCQRDYAENIQIAELNTETFRVNLFFCDLDRSKTDHGLDYCSPGAQTELVRYPCNGFELRAKRASRTSRKSTFGGKTCDLRPEPRISRLFYSSGACGPKATRIQSTMEQFPLPNMFASSPRAVGMF
jgi:hypothetical protein